MLLGLRGNERRVGIACGSMEEHHGMVRRREGNKEKEYVPVDTDFDRHVEEFFGVCGKSVLGMRRKKKKKEELQKPSLLNAVSSRME